MIKFTQLNHSYKSVNTAEAIDWIGITSLCDAFKKSFDPVSGSIKASRNPKSKWYKMEPELIRSIWKGESNRSLSIGSWYHDITEADLLSREKHQGLNIVKPIYSGIDKIAPEQKLINNNLYPEHFAYLQSHGICGQTDRVDIKDHRINLVDYKSFKVMKTEGFTNWEGISERMLDPISHLDSCNFVSGALQLSFYLYMILKHNPQFLPGKLSLEHIIFEQESEDQYGYPIYKKDNSGQFIIKEVKPYPVFYLKSEVISILNYLQENRGQVKATIESNRNK